MNNVVLTSSESKSAAPQNLAQIIHARLKCLGGLDLPLPDSAPEGEPREAVVALDIEESVNRGQSKNTRSCSDSDCPLLL